MKKIISMFVSFLLVLNLSFVLSSVFVNADEAYLWPAQGTQKINQYYSSSHDGLDIGGSLDTPIRATMSGTVVAVIDGDVANKWIGYGKGVVIQHSNGYYSHYAHMNYTSVSVNQYVSQGQQIGGMGTTGNSTGVHLHFAVATSMYGAGGRIDVNPGVINYIYDFNPPHTHGYTIAITKQATCTEQGIRTYTCSCGNSYTEAIAAIGHSYKNTIVAPTSDNHGYTLHECSRCGYSYKDTYTNPIEDDSWIYTSKLPDNITEDKYEIQYQNIYRKDSSSSPGNEWKKGELVSSGYENVGSPYDSNIELETSDTRTLLGYFYYHYCSGVKGNEANYESNSTFPHYDYISSEGVYEEKTGLDSADNRYRYYYLKWNNGSYAYCNSDISCGGVAGAHGNRSYVWYKCCTYQDKKKVDIYNWTKESDWQIKADSEANKITYRYRKLPDSCGDVNFDWKITIQDAMLLRDYLIKKCEFNEIEFVESDMDGNGKVNVLDYMILKRQICN